MRSFKNRLRAPEPYPRSACPSPQELKLHDLVLSRPEDDPEGAVQPKRVVSLFQSYSPLMDLHVGGQVIRTTAEHPFWVVGQGWVAAHQIQVGDLLLGAVGGQTPIESISDPAEPAPVYNVEVEEYHTYFVGHPFLGLAVWSHNAKGCVSIKPGDTSGPTSGKPFPESVKAAARAENPTLTFVFCKQPGTATQVDHAIPKSCFGNATIDNAQMACQHCNASKGARNFPVTPPAGYVGPWPPP